MKSIKWLSFVFICTAVVCASESPIGNEESIDETEVAYCKAIDTLFAQAQESLAEKKDIITLEWLGKKTQEIRYLMSDVSVVVCFDRYAKEVIAKKLQDHLRNKIYDHIEKDFERRDDATVEELRQFLYLSETACKISEGTDCDRMMRIIKDDSFPVRQNLKMKEKMRRQVEKEEMRRVCQIVILGAQPR